MNTPFTHDRPPAAAGVWLMRLLAAVALGVCGVLLVHASQSTGLPGCGQGSGCDTVLNSPWSKVGPIPSAALACGLYAVMFVSLLRLKRRLSWMLLLLGSVVAVGAAGWFIFVQIYFIGAWCKYCMTVHLCGVVLAMLVWINAPLDPLRLRISIIAIGLGSVAIVATTQLLFPPPTTRVTTLLDGAIQLEVKNLPTLGNPDTAIVLVELFDYTCPHCKRLSTFLRDAQQHYSEPFTIVALPVPLNKDCNRYVTTTHPMQKDACKFASLALAVWHATPHQFPAIHHWLFEQQGKITVAQARAYAVKLVGESALKTAMNNPAIAQRISINISLYHYLGGGLPKLIFENIRIDGRPETREELFDLLEQYTPLGIRE